MCEVEIRLVRSVRSKLVKPVFGFIAKHIGSIEFDKQISQLLQAGRIKTAPTLLQYYNTNATMT